MPRGGTTAVSTDDKILLKLPGMNLNFKLIPFVFE